MMSESKIDFHLIAAALATLQLFVECELKRIIHSSTQITTSTQPPL